MKYYVVRFLTLSTLWDRCFESLVCAKNVEEIYSMYDNYRVLILGIDEKE